MTMNTEIKKNEQMNLYKVFDSMGRQTNVCYCASNFNDAFEKFKDDTINYQKYYYGKLKRIYNGGVRG